MTDLTDFFSHAWKTIGRAIVKTALRAGLLDMPEMVTKAVRRRCTADLKRLGMLLRRLIFLMALHVELAPVKPRAGSNYFEKTDGEANKRAPAFSVMPVQASAAPDFPRGPITVPDRGPVSAAPLIARWEAMAVAFKYAGRRAKCLARTLQRQRAAGMPRPYIMPVPKLHALPAAIAIVSGGLTVQLQEALKTWPEPDTG